MTVEEIEILVTAKVEEALKEFQKFLPAIKKQMKQVQEVFSKVNMKEFDNKIRQSVNKTKKQLEIMKRASENNKIALLVTNKDAQKQINQITKAIRSLKKQTEQRHKIQRF